jgi:hypothetical protein
VETAEKRESVIIHNLCNYTSKNFKSNNQRSSDWSGCHCGLSKPFPEDETVKLVKKKLNESNIEYSRLADWPMENCM